MKDEKYFRIIDANLNRANEALRCIEEYVRFILNDNNLTEKLKNIRHNINLFYKNDYNLLIKARDTQNDVGVDIVNITKQTNTQNPLIANLKRLQEALRVLTEYGTLDEKYRYQMYTIEKELMEKLEKKTDIKKALLKDKNIYLITNSDNLDEDEFLDIVSSALQNGVKIIQYREKTKSALEIIRIGKKLRQLTSMYDALLIVNDRIDIAQLIDADGVHLGQDDIDILDARKILGDDKIIGISTHKPDDAIVALKNKADYIGVGPVFKTPTKPNTNPVGLDYVKWVKENINLPFYAIGSIDNDNVNLVVEAGAKRIAVIRAIMQSNDIKTTVDNFKKALK